MSESPTDDHCESREFRAFGCATCGGHLVLLGTLIFWATGASLGSPAIWVSAIACGLGWPMLIIGYALCRR